MTSFAAAPHNFYLRLAAHQGISGSFKTEGEGRLKPKARSLQNVVAAHNKTN
jgi:hypothetical protein